MNLGGRGPYAISMHGQNQNVTRDRVVESFRRRHGREPEVVVRAPGRVALLGAHIDYSEGWVLPGAIERAVWLAASSTDDRQWTLSAADLVDESGRPREKVLPLDRLPAPIPGSDRPVSWFDYPTAVAWSSAEAGRKMPGLEAVYGGDLPRGAGVSSSAAVEVAFLLAAAYFNGETDPDRLSLARAARRAENGYLGLGSGLMDPYASLFGKRDHLVLLDCRTETHEWVPLPSGLAVWVVSSGVERRLAGSGFNDRRGQCAAAVRLLEPFVGSSLRSLRYVDPSTFERHAHRLPAELRRRAAHAVYEMERVQEAAGSLRQGDVKAFGRAMNASHRSSRDLYEVTIPELDVLCAAGWSTPGCLGAKLMGGGFGGCVAFLIEGTALDDVRRAVDLVFEMEFGRRPEGFVTTPADGAEIFPARLDGPARRCAEL